MTSTEQQLSDPDIIDHSFIYDDPGTLQLTKQKEPTGAYVPIIMPQLQNQRGRRTQTKIETQIGNTLCLYCVASIYSLESLGLSAQQARDMVESQLTSMGIEKAIRRGRKASLDILNIHSVKEMENFYRNKSLDNQHTENLRKFKEQAVNALLKSVHLLDLTYARSKQFFSELHNLQRTKSSALSQKKLHQALSYKNGEPIPLPDIVSISIFTRVNSVMIWPSYWYFRHILDAAACVGLLNTGHQAELNGVQLYTLYRLCEKNSDQKSSELNSCKCIIQSNMDHVYEGGRLKFLDDARQTLGKWESPDNRPKSVSELESPSFGLINLHCTISPKRLSRS